MSARIGIISNAHSRRNKISMREFHALLSEHPEVAHVSFDAIDELPGCFARLAKLDISHLVISGGDGTVLAAVSHLINSSPFKRTPSLSLLSAGMTNVIAHEVGQADLPAIGLKRLVARVAAGEAGEIVEKSVMSVDFGDGRPIERGFLMGAIGFYQGTQLARRDIHGLGFKHFFAARLGIAWSLAKILFLGPGRASGFHCEDIGLTLDGRHENRRSLLFLATTLDSIMPGITPFWGEGPGRIRVTTIDCPARRFIRAILPALRGKPKPWMEKAGYVSRRAERIELEVRSPIVIDGETFAPPASGRVTVSAGPTVRFHRF